MSLGGSTAIPMRRRVTVIFGTRPEIIKLAPVVAALKRESASCETCVVNSGQHTDLLRPFLERFRLEVDHDLNVMQPGQTPNQTCARILGALDPVLQGARSDVVLVQGDTSTALAGALAAFHHRIPIGHVEAGLRSGDGMSPYPEEMNRRLITRLASFHFAATPQNRRNLLAEGVRPETIFVTGNPIVDALEAIRKDLRISRELQRVLDATEGSRRLVLTAHRRENVHGPMAGYLHVLRQFVERHEDVVVLFPVHPNPAVRELAGTLLADHPRIRLLKPFDYEDFIGLISRAWLILSDSGGVQEEAPTLGKPLLVLRENTERPEAIESGVARLVGGDPARLADLLEQVYRDDAWIRNVERVANPFGRGDSAGQIVRALRPFIEA